MAGIRTRLVRVRLIDGDYDRGGSYWGGGAPLWVAWDAEGGEVYLRASTREAAKAQLREHFEGVSFYR